MLSAMGSLTNDARHKVVKTYIYGNGVHNKRENVVDPQDCGKRTLRMQWRQEAITRKTGMTANDGDWKARDGDSRRKLADIQLKNACYTVIN